jgi:hypothetical protein
VEKSKDSKIINGFCYISGEKVIFVDLVTEKTENYKISYFQKFINDNSIDEYCIFLANREGGFVTPLYKYKLQTAKSKTPIKSSTRSVDELVTLCFKVCIEMFQKVK